MNTEPGASRHPTAAIHFELRHDAFGRLVLVGDDGHEHVGVAPVRLFPLSDPKHWISLCDAEGREILCLESLEALPRATRETLERELAEIEFLPEIERIVKVSSNIEPSDWLVETDRGTTTFRLNSDDDVHRLGSFGVVIIDDHDVRYLISDLRRLDAASQRVLDRYV